MTNGTRLSTTCVYITPLQTESCVSTFWPNIKVSFCYGHCSKGMSLYSALNCQDNIKWQPLQVKMIINTPGQICFLKARLVLFFILFNLGHSEMDMCNIAGLEFHLWKGKGVFILQRALPLGNQCESFEGAPRPRPRALETMALMACL